MSEILAGELLKIAVLVGLSLAGILIIQLGIKNRARKISYFRIFVQIVSEFAIFYLISYSLWLSLVLATVLLITPFVGRVFCGWICPFGFYMDLVSLLRQALKKRYLNLPDRINSNLNRLRYVLLAVFFVLPFGFLNLSPWNMWSIQYLAGPFNPLRILLGPLVPVIAPWKTLYNSNLNYPYLDQIVHYSSENSALFNVIAFVALTLLSAFVVRRFWCRFCPTGASVAIGNRLRGGKWMPVLHLEKDGEKCTKCGICKRVCTVQVTEVYEKKEGKIDTSMCMLCLRCVEMCPYEGCLKVKFAGKTLAESRNWLEPSTNE
ncbi:MAG: 4Fe-4S binding protein [Candidatus Bathyarchaeota archaeon]|nr:4Fe-4S binding protein [Candidatus Bathyarchaeota archaeon]